MLQSCKRRRPIVNGGKRQHYPFGDTDTDMGTTVLLREERGRRNGSVKFGDGDIRAKRRKMQKYISGPPIFFLAKFQFLIPTGRYLRKLPTNTGASGIILRINSVH